METELTKAIHEVIAQAKGFAVPCIFIIVVTMGVIMAWDILGALWRFASGPRPPRGPRHHQVW